jgi:acyl dehydratase
MKLNSLSIFIRLATRAGTIMTQTQQDLDVYSKLTSGEEIGYSSWVEITQAMIDGFADVTLDQDPMHVDPDWSRRNTPYGGTIAFGFLTLSLLTHMLKNAMLKRDENAEHEGGYYLNYGIDYMRLLAPVPVGSRIRGKFKTLDNRIDRNGRNIVKFGCEVEIEGGDKPVLVVEWLSIFVPEEGR